jgi:hypothetical protein
VFSYNLKTKNKKELKTMKKLVIPVIVMSLTGALSLTSLAFNSSLAKEEKFIKNHEIVELEFKDEYIWTMQRELSPNENINELLYYVEKLNGKKFHEYKRGDKILLLKENVSM